MNFISHLFHPVTTTPMFILAIVLSTLFFVAMLTVMHYLPPQAKKWLTIICTFVAGLYFALEYFLPVHKMVALSGEKGNLLTPTLEPVNNYIQFIFVWTIGLGIISLAIVHGQRLLKRQNGWHHSLAFFLAMIGIMVVGFMSKMGQAGHPATQIAYKSLFNGLLINLDTAMFSLLAFYIASAAYRAFRVRTAEAVLLMVSALVIMLGLVEFGVWMTHGIPLHSPWAFFRFEQLMAWLLNWFNMPVQRAVGIGVQVGALAMALRIWLSLERGAFFSQEK